MSQIKNSDNYTLISGTSDNDSIVNSGTVGVTIDTGAGDDFISSNGDVVIKSASGNNVVNPHPTKVGRFLVPFKETDCLSTIRFKLRYL